MNTTAQKLDDISCPLCGAAVPLAVHESDLALAQHVIVHHLPEDVHGDRWCWCPHFFAASLHGDMRAEAYYFRDHLNSHGGILQHLAESRLT